MNSIENFSSSHKEAKNKSQALNKMLGKKRYINPVHVFSFFVEISKEINCDVKSIMVPPLSKAISDNCSPVAEALSARTSGSVA